MLLEPCNGSVTIVLLLHLVSALLDPNDSHGVQRWCTWFLCAMTGETGRRPRRGRIRTVEKCKHATEGNGKAQAIGLGGSLCAVCGPEPTDHIPKVQGFDAAPPHKHSPPSRHVP